MVLSAERDARRVAVRLAQLSAGARRLDARQRRFLSMGRRPGAAGSQAARDSCCLARRDPLPDLRPVLVPDRRNDDHDFPVARSQARPRRYPDRAHGHQAAARPVLSRHPDRIRTLARFLCSRADGCRCYADHGCDIRSADLARLHRGRIAQPESRPDRTVSARRAADADHLHECALAWRKLCGGDDAAALLHGLCGGGGCSGPIETGKPPIPGCSRRSFSRARSSARLT